MHIVMLTNKVRELAQQTADEAQEMQRKDNEQEQEAQTRDDEGEANKGEKREGDEKKDPEAEKKGSDSDEETEDCSTMAGLTKRMRKLQVKMRVQNAQLLQKLNSDVLDLQSKMKDQLKSLCGMNTQDTVSVFICVCLCVCMSVSPPPSFCPSYAQFPDLTVPMGVCALEEA